MLKKISSDEFPALDMEEVYGIVDPAILQIYKFYKSHSQDDIYLLDISDTDKRISSLVALDSIQIYSLYGIFVNTEYNNNNVLIERKNHMLIVSEEDLSDKNKFHERIQNEIETDFDGVIACILEVDYLKDSDRVEAACDFVLSELPDVIFLNAQRKFLSAAIPAAKRSDKFAYIDVTESVNKYGPQYIDFTKDVSRLLELRNLLLTYKDKKNVVLTVSSLDPVLQRVFCCIAVECIVVHKMMFELPREIGRFFWYYMRRLYQKEYCYFDEYLKMLMNPIDIGFMYKSTGDGYLCVLENEKLYTNGIRDYSKYVLLCSIISVPFDIGKRCITGTEVSSINVGPERIITYSLRDLYDLGNPDHEIACKNAEEFGKVLCDFEQAILESQFGFLEKDALHCSNVLLYEFRGKTLLGYVINTTGTYPYRIFPISKGYTSFETEISVSEYTDICDICVLDDANNLIASLLRKRVITGNKWHRDVTSVSRGILLSALPTDRQMLRGECGLTVEEICMWESVSASIRTGRGSFVIDKVPHKILRDKRFLTAFGGPNPMITKQFFIESSSWK
ncbi:hypothetical protein AALB53_08345 [Lachnospiraceae bacterium 47-T17]